METPDSNPLQPSPHETGDQSSIDVERAARLAEVKALFGDFDSIPQGNRPVSCEKCGSGRVRQRDKVVSAGGSGVTVTTLTYCDCCGDHSISEPSFDSDY